MRYNKGSISGYSQSFLKQYYNQQNSSAAEAMVRNYTNIIWFDADSWIGSVVAFDDHLSKWTLDQKLHEAADYEDAFLVKNSILDSEARGVFACSNVHDQTQQAVVKIRMQYGLPHSAAKYLPSETSCLGYRTLTPHSSLPERGRSRPIRV